MSEPKHQVGRGRPPKQSQFRKGQSGNPSGRPRGARTLHADLVSELQSITEATVGGSRVRISKGRLLMKALIAKAAQGDMKALALLVSMTARLQQDEPPAPSNSVAATPPEDAAIVAAFLKRARRGGGDE